MCTQNHLLEYTLVTNRKGVQKNHKKWLNQNMHLRYMWIPDTDSVVVVQCNPLPEGKEAPKVKQISNDKKLRHVRTLYRETAATYRFHNVPESAGTDSEPRSPSGKEGMWSGIGAGREQGGQETKLLTDVQLSEVSFTKLRDVLSFVDPHNQQHFLNINKAEYWKRSEGYRVGWSDEILGFYYDGQQSVSEVPFAGGTLKKPDMRDIKFMVEILKLIKLLLNSDGQQVP